MITLHPIRDDEDHARAMSQVEQFWGAQAGTPESDALEVLVTLIDAYEAKHHAIEPPDPIEAILFRMEQQGLTRNDLIPMIGSRARVSEVLNRKRPLTLAMIQRLRAGLGISADVLLGRPTLTPPVALTSSAGRSGSSIPASSSGAGSGSP